MNKLLPIIIASVSLACSSTDAEQTDNVPVPGLEAAFKALVQQLDTMHRAPAYAPAGSRERQQGSARVQLLQDKVWDLLVKSDDAGIDSLERLIEPLLKRRLNYQSPQQCVWTLVRSICFNRNWSNERKEALLHRCLSDKSVPILVKAWLIHDADTFQSAAQVIPENVMLDVCEQLMSVKTPVYLFDAWAGSGEKEILYDETGKPSGTRKIGGSRHYLMLMTGRDVASSLIQSLYGPEDMDWPDPSQGTSAEATAQREEAAKIAEKWIEKRRMRYRLQAALLEALENHRDTGLTDSTRISEAFNLFVGYTDKNRHDVVKRLMNLLLVEVARKEKDSAFIRPLARSIEKVCEKNGSQIRPADEGDLKNVDTCRKWLADVIDASMKKPSSYFNKKAWQTLAEELGLATEDAAGSGESKQD